MRESAEQSRERAESDRASAENSRESAEQRRLSAEAGRETAEENREQAERDREVSEEARQQAEQTRAANYETLSQAIQSAEVLRESAEQSRERAESDRASAENSRETAEQSRELAEGRRQTTFEQNEAARGQQVEEKVEKLTPFAEKMNEVTDISRDFGKYNQLPDVALTPVYTGKRFNSKGELVDDVNWNVGRFGQVERGLLYELFMGSEDKMVLGTALFVSHTIEKIGSTNKDVYTPVFSAMGTRLPISTYAVLWAGENYEDLLVSYRNDVEGANIMKSAEWGLFKSIATQYANLKARVDLKSFADGYYQGMRTGLTDAIAPSGTAPTYDESLGGRQVNNAPEMMGNRTASATNSVSNISVREMRGLAIVGNQIHPELAANRGWNANPSFTNGEMSKTGSGWNSSSNNVPFEYGHQHLLIVSVKAVGQTNISIIFGGNYESLKGLNESYQVKYVILRPLINTTFGYQNGNSGASVCSWSVKDASLLDLTTLFPRDPTFVNSLTSNDAIKVAHKLSFFAYDRDNANAVTHDEQGTLAKMAEVCAKLGYQPDAKLCLGSAGRINLVDGNTGRIKQTIDMISAKTKAWNSALAVLRERGIAIPTMLERPSEFGINNQVGVIWRNDRLTINAWIKIGTEAQDSELLVGDKIVFPLAEPIEIMYDEILNINLVDAKPYDLYTLDDIDGEAMYEVEVTPNADGTYHTIVAPKGEWVESHKQLPVTIPSTLAGIGTNINYDYILNLEARVKALENK